MINLTAEQWELYEKKYGKLLWKISHCISGDNAIASIEDNYRDLVVAAIDSMNGFNKKTGKTFDEFIEDPMFSKYTKTCLWNYKNNKGSEIKKRYPITKKCVPIENNEEVLLIEDPHANKECENSFIDELSSLLGREEKEVLSGLVNNPGVLTQDGVAKAKALSEKINVSSYKIRKSLQKIGEVIKNEYF